MRIYSVGCLEIEAENPYQAVMYFLGRISDPDLRDIPFEWIVVDKKAKKGWKIAWSISEIDAESTKQVDATIKALKRPARPRRRKNPKK